MLLPERERLPVSRKAHATENERRRAGYDAHDVIQPRGRGIGDLDKMASHRENVKHRIKAIRAVRLETGIERGDLPRLSDLPRKFECNVGM